MSIMRADEFGTCTIEGPLPTEALACRIIAAVVLIPIFIPALHSPLRRMIRPTVCLADFFAVNPRTYALLGACILLVKSYRNSSGNIRWSNLTN